MRRIRLEIPEESEPAFEAVRHLDGQHLDIPIGQAEWKVIQNGHYVVFTFLGGEREHRRDPAAPDRFIEIDVFRPSTWGPTSPE